MRAAAEEISERGGVPFAGFVSDPCDGRSQGTTGMFDSFPYRNDAAKVQTIGLRYAQNELSLEDADDLGCRACGTHGGGCQFLGTAATSQVVAEALRISLPHYALAVISIVDGDGVYLHRGKAKVFTSEKATIDEKRKNRGWGHHGRNCSGPLGSGMKETYQLTLA